MNEKIKELQAEAYRTCKRDDNGYVRVVDFNEKFAELIGWKQTLNDTLE